MKRTKLRADAREAIEEGIRKAQQNPNLPNQSPYDVAAIIMTELTKAGIKFARIPQ